MNILHVNASYKPARIYGGPTVSVSMLCEALVTAGIQTDVFTTTANGETELDVVTSRPSLIDGVNVTYFKRITKDHSHFSPALLLKLWQSAKHYDIIHIHAWWNTVSVLACLIGLQKKVPVVVSPRGMLSDYSLSNQNTGKKSIIHSLIGKRLLNKVFIHVTTESEKLEVEKLVNPVGISIIPNMIKLPSEIFDHRDNKFFKIIFLSRIDPKKGLDILIEALGSVNHPWQLTIAGMGDEDYISFLKSKADELEISSNIDWVGFAGEEKFKLLSQHDLFVLPSHNENFGNAVIESLSVGTAVLLSEGVGLADYVSKNNLGWVCPALPAQLAETINDIMTNPHEDLHRIRTQSPQVIKRDFDQSVLVQYYINLYQQVIAHERV